MKRPLHALPIRFTKVAAKLLTDFANKDLEGFASKWSEGVGTTWIGGVESFAESQRVVREVWEGKMGGAQAVSWGLGLIADRPEYQGSSMQLIRVDWERSSLFLTPRDLNEYVWLSLLQYSQRLGLCENHGGDCKNHYFVKIKPNQKFCTEECALPAQREFKRQWWDSHGQQWRRKRAKKKGGTTKGRR
jgi:hypothetical protein